MAKQKKAPGKYPIPTGSETPQPGLKKHRQLPLPKFKA